MLTTQICYLYTNYPEERVPLPLACDLINQSEAVKPQHGSAVTFVPCIESSPAYIGYLAFASGPDLCTLSMFLITVLLVAMLLPIPSCRRCSS